MKNFLVSFATLVALATFTLQLPLMDHSAHHMARTFDFLARLMLIASFLIALLFVVMYRKSRQTLKLVSK